MNSLEQGKQMLAEIALKLGAVRLSVQKPFLWASGYYMPIYNDNRSFLALPEARKLIASLFEQIMKDHGLKPAIIAGTATAGIAHATTLADRLGLPTCYVRSASKDHGLGNQIEGLGLAKGFDKAEVLLIEDLVSTGKSSIAAVNAIRDADGLCSCCLSIFTYGLPAAQAAFDALDPGCQCFSILDYDYVIDRAVRTHYISEEDCKLLRTWRLDPFSWGLNNGFEPRL